MYFSELDNESRRRLIDVQQRATALRDAAHELNHRFSGSMVWRHRANQGYLYRRTGRIEKSLGPRSPETEAIHAAFNGGKNVLEQGNRVCANRSKPWHASIVPLASAVFPT
jgi:hypothetical protein